MWRAGRFCLGQELFNRLRSVNGEGVNLLLRLAQKRRGVAAIPLEEKSNSRQSWKG